MRAGQEAGKTGQLFPLPPPPLPQCAGFSLLELALCFPVVGLELPRTSRTFPGGPLPRGTRLLPSARLPACPLASLVCRACHCALSQLLAFDWGWRAPTFLNLSWGSVLCQLLVWGLQKGRNEGKRRSGSIVNGILAHEGRASSGPRWGPRLQQSSDICVPGAGAGSSLSAAPERAVSWGPRLPEVHRILRMGGCALWVGSWASARLLPIAALGGWEDTIPRDRL